MKSSSIPKDFFCKSSVPQLKKNHSTGMRRIEVKKNHSTGVRRIIDKSSVREERRKVNQAELSLSETSEDEDDNMRVNFRLEATRIQEEKQS